MLGLLLAFLAGALAASGAWLWWAVRRLEERAAELARVESESFLHALQIGWMRDAGVGQ